MTTILISEFINGVAGFISIYFVSVVYSRTNFRSPISLFDCVA